MTNHALERSQCQPRWRSVGRRSTGRYVAMTQAVLAVLAGLGWGSAIAAEISMRSVGPGIHEFVLTSPTPLSEEEARAQIARAAASVCKGVPAVPGKWRFESSERIGGGAPSPSVPNAFRFVQEFACRFGVQAPSAARLPALKNEEEIGRVRDEVKVKSETYFKLISSKRVDEAVANVATAGMGVSEAKWKGDRLSFQSIAGDPVQITIAKVTVYDNPANAPAPGLYVAADYSNVYRNVPIHCGYLMWYRPVGGSEFLIIREEGGHVTSEQLKSIPASQLPEIKRRLLCVSP